MSKKLKHKYTIEEIMEIARNIGGKCLSTEYINSRTKMIWECKKGHIWNATIMSIVNNHWCRKCYDESLLLKFKYDLNDCKKAAENFEGKCLSESYQGINEFMKWECKEGHIWNARFKNVLAGNWCLECANQSFRTSINDIDLFVKSLGGKLISRTYKNCYTKMEWECQKGHRWHSTCSNIFSGRWCPLCKTKTQEKLTRIISELFPDLYVESNARPFDWLKNKKTNYKLTLDIYVKDVGLAIEYDGAQHFHPVNFFGMSDEKAEKYFVYLKELDKIKDDLIPKHEECIKNFIRFSYFEDINKDFVVEKIKKMWSQYLMAKIVMFSDQFLPTFPYLDLPLYGEFKKSIDTEYVLQKGDYRLVDSRLNKAFVPITTVVSNPKKDLLDIVSAKDLLVIRFAYKGVGGDVINSLIKNKRRVIALDPAAVDLKHRECVAPWITSKSEWMRQQVIKKFPGRYKSIFPVGTIHFDAAFQLGRVDKKKFMESYGLDSTKKLAILTPSNPAEATHQKGVDTDYAEIVKIAKKCQDYEIMVKAHPSDYSKKLAALPGIIHKFEYYGKNYSWEMFAPGIKVVRAEEGYEALSCADVVLNVRSSIAMEVPFFDVPLINVNRHKYLTNWPASKNPGVMKDIKIEELEITLNDGKFEADHEARTEYVMKFCDPVCDGNAYKRTAKVAMGLMR